jgi:predicted DNA-binding transcriptional regulator YafY
LKTAVTKIKNNSNIDVDNKLGIRLNGYPGDLDDALSKLISSIQSGRAVELTYISIGSDNIVKIVVDPYNVIYKEGEWHLIGLEHRLNQVRNYQLKRVEKIKTTNLISIKPINFSLSKYINNSWGAFIGDKIKVVIRFDQKSKNIITNHKWHYNQVLEVIEEGDILLKLYLDNISEIKNWVMGFGSAAEVVEPLQLREEIKVEVDKLKNIYSA